MKPAVRALVAFLILIFLLSLFLYTVDETKQIVITQFGEPVRVVSKPGIHVKLPFPIQSAHKFERRILEHDAAPAEVLTGDKKNLVVDNYAKWRISDPLKFMKTVANENGAQARLDDIIYSKMREAIGKVSFTDVIGVHRDSVMMEVTAGSNIKAGDYGISVLDVRIKRADLPEENERYVFARMQAERLRQANLYRSEGKQQGTIIQAQTDKEKEIILAEAFGEAEKLMGRGDAEATRIYAQAYGKDPEFYGFVRTLEAYKKSLDDQTAIVLPAEGRFLSYLEGAEPRKK